MECVKCGSGNITTTYVPAGKLINSSSMVRVNDEFIRSSEYDYFYKLKAKIEHLLKKCDCGYTWREAISP